MLEFGRLLDKQWKLKRGLTDKITNHDIDEIYQAGMDAGAVGGKLWEQVEVGSCFFLQNRARTKR